MVPASLVGDASSGRELDLPEIIFSCGICQKSPAEIYASPENNKGFHSGSGDDDGMVTRLWLSECMHVTCGRHLPGGAAPFHPVGALPQAPCPQCMRDRGDHALKDLYGIRGVSEGEHDAAIPEAWFRCPPITIEGADPGMDALRFQYVALSKYAQKVQRRWRDAEQRSSTSEQDCAKERKRRKQMETELQQMATDAAASATVHEKTEAQLKKWRDRQPVINHYLGIVKFMADDVAHMRAQLVELGYKVPTRDYQYGGPSAHDPHPSETRQTAAAGISSSSTAVADQMELSSNSQRKRKHADREQHSEVQRLNGPGKQRTTSREMMPPPFLKPTQAQIQSRSHQPGTFRQTPQVQRDDEDVVMMDRSSRIPALPLRNPIASRLRDEPVTHDMPSARHLSVNSRHEERRPLETFRFQSTAPTTVVHSRNAHRDPAGYLGQSHPATTITNDRSNQFARDQDFNISSTPRRGPQYELQDTVPSSSWGRRPRDPYNPFTQPQRRSQPTEMQNPFAPRLDSALKPLQPPGPSVISPFFKRNDMTSRTTGYCRPPSPARNDGQESRSQTTGYHRAQQFGQYQRELRNGVPQSRTSLYGQVPQSQASQSFSQRQFRPPTMTFKQGLQSAIPPTRDTYQPASRARPSVPSLSSSQQVPGNRPAPTFARSRISLPPSTSRTDDVEVATVPGIRGGYNQRVGVGYAGPGTSYLNSRSLFSAAGRQSVRR